MSSTISSSSAAANAAIARELNRFLETRGGEPIHGLENLDPQKLAALQHGVQGFLDTYDKPGPNGIADIVGNDALESMREFARLLAKREKGESGAKGAKGGARRMAMGGGGGGGAVASGAPGSGGQVAAQAVGGGGAMSGQAFDLGGIAAALGAVGALGAGGGFSPLGLNALGG